ncbi:hypothetical protein Slin15195_G000580 [Septoria linicola]|uniref:Apple domain-containing protein n=1 Tax=Septoria linicola TaxID=215465 RepID=A0A9Q9EEB6_9PEZI|nr:hypothetical protein Slin15195_G000580 [Septoria linicola]
MFIIAAILLLCQVSSIWAHASPQVCHRQPYKEIECLKQYSPAKSHCAKNYPIQPATRTSTAQAVTVTKTTGTTTVTDRVSTKTITLQATTVTKESTAYTTVTLLQGSKEKRNARGYTASLYSSLLARKPSIVKTACACIQTPSTRTIWVTPTSTIRAKKTVYAQGTTTKSIRPKTTKYLAITKTTTVYSTTSQYPTTIASTTSPSLTTSSTSTPRTTTTSTSTTSSEGSPVAAPPCPASREDICASDQLTCSSSNGVNYDTECGVEYIGDEIVVTRRQRKRAAVDTFDECQALCDENACVGLNYIARQLVRFDYKLFSADDLRINDQFLWADDFNNHLFWADHFNNQLF